MEQHVSSKSRRSLNAALLVATFIFSATCGDSSSVAPGTGGQASFSLSPNFAALPAGAPSIPLSKVQATVTGQDDKSVTHEAQFANGSATLTFNVTVSGSSSKFQIEYAAFDLQGVLAYSGQQTITVHAGPNDSVPSPTLVLDGPDAKITALQVAPNPVTLYAGNTVNLTPTGILPNEQTLTPRVAWTSSNTAIATISDAGVLTGASQGTATITATSANGLTATVPVTVTGIALGPDSVEKLLGDTQQFSVANAPEGTQFTWGVNGIQGGNATFGTITASGLYTAPRTMPTPSTFQVCATQAAATGCAKVVLSQITALRVAPNPVTLFIGATVNLTVTGTLPNGGTITPSVVWTSSNPAIATIDAAGVLTGTAPGTATITATWVNGLAATVPVTVTGIKILPDSVEKLLGGTQQFSVADAPQGTQFAWSVNGVQGGNTTFGTITTSGFYTAPRTLPTPSTFQVCATLATATGCAKVVLSQIPTGGADVIVLNDINTFQNDIGSNANNQQFFRNLVQFSSTGPRGNQTGVLMHRGHASVCDLGECSAGFTTLSSTLAAVGFSFTQLNDGTATIQTIPSNIKVILLWTPTTPYSNTEINVLKAFAGEGGRIVFVGEHQGFYGTTGIAVENAFFASMGAQMTNTGGQFECNSGPELPATSLRTHQVTTGMTGLTIACASQVVPGPNDYPFLYDSQNTVVLGAVAKIDLTPIPIILNLVPARSAATPVTPKVSSSGRLLPVKTP